MELLKECAPAFSMLQDENRQQILLLLFDQGEMTVSALTDSLSISRPAVSHHAKLLLDAGLVAVRKEGKERYYRVDLAPAVARLRELIVSLERDMGQ